MAFDCFFMLLCCWKFPQRRLKCEDTLALAAMARRSNAATAKDLVRIFRGNIGSLESADTMLSLDGFVSKHEILLKEILEQTLRPTSSVLGVAQLAPSGSEKLLRPHA